MLQTSEIKLHATSSVLSCRIVSCTERLFTHAAKIFFLSLQVALSLSLAVGDRLM